MLHNYFFPNEKVISVIHEKSSNVYLIDIQSVLVINVFASYIIVIESLKAKHILKTYVMAVFNSFWSVTDLGHW